MKLLVLFFVLIILYGGLNMIQEAKGSVELLTEDGDTVVISNNEIKELVNELLLLRKVLNDFLDDNSVSMSDENKKNLLSVLGVIL